MHGDDKTIRELNSGSHETFRNIYDAHKFRIPGLAGSCFIAEELFPQVFVKLLRDNRTACPTLVILYAEGELAHMFAAAP